MHQRVKPQQAPPVPGSHLPVLVSPRDASLFLQQEAHAAGQQEWREAHERVERLGSAMETKHAQVQQKLHRLEEFVLSLDLHSKDNGERRVRLAENKTDMLKDGCEKRFVMLEMGSSRERQERLMQERRVCEEQRKAAEAMDHRLLEFDSHAKGRAQRSAQESAQEVHRLSKSVGILGERVDDVNVSLRSQAEGTRSSLKDLATTTKLLVSTEAKKVRDLLKAEIKVRTSGAEKAKKAQEAMQQSLQGEVAASAQASSAKARLQAARAEAAQRSLQEQFDKLRDDVTTRLDATSAKQAADHAAVQESLALAREQCAALASATEESHARLAGRVQELSTSCSQALGDVRAELSQEASGKASALEARVAAVQAALNMALASELVDRKEQVAQLRNEVQVANTQVRGAQTRLEERATVALQDTRAEVLAALAHETSALRADAQETRKRHEAAEAALAPRLQQMGERADETALSGQREATRAVEAETLLASELAARVTEVRGETFEAVRALQERLLQALEAKYKEAIAHVDSEVDTVDAASRALVQEEALARTVADTELRAAVRQAAAEQQEHLQLAVDAVEASVEAVSVEGATARAADKRLLTQHTEASVAAALLQKQEEAEIRGVLFGLCADVEQDLFKERCEQMEGKTAGEVDMLAGRLRQLRVDVEAAAGSRQAEGDAALQRVSQELAAEAAASAEVLGTRVADIKTHFDDVCAVLQKSAAEAKAEAADVAEGVRTEVEGKVGAAREATRAALQGAVGDLQVKIDEQAELRTEAEERVKVLGTSVADITSHVDDVCAVLQKSAEEAKADAADVVQGVRTEVKEKMEAARETTRAALQGAVDELQTKFDEQEEQVKVLDTKVADITTHVDDVCAVLQKSAEEAKANAADVVQGVRTEVKEKMEAARDTTRAALQGAVDELQAKIDEQAEVQGSGRSAALEGTKGALKAEAEERAERHAVEQEVAFEEMRAANADTKHQVFEVCDGLRATAAEASKAAEEAVVELRENVDKEVQLIKHDVSALKALTNSVKKRESQLEKDVLFFAKDGLDLKEEVGNLRDEMLESPTDDADDKPGDKPGDKPDDKPDEAKLAQAIVQEESKKKEEDGVFRGLDDPREREPATATATATAEAQP